MIVDDEDRLAGKLAHPALGVGSGLGLSGGRRFDPSILFANGEQGVWFDTSDLSTMFQDANGVTPAVVGQPVGLHLDKSKGLAMGNELRATGAVSTTGSPGSPGSYNTAIGAGSTTRTDPSNLAGVNFTVTANTWYLIDVEKTSGGTLDLRTAVLGSVLVTPITGRMTLRINSAASTALVFVAGNNATTATFTVHSIKTIAGNHRYQATAASRPILGRHPAGGRRNLLTYAEDLTNAAWNKANATISGNGKIVPSAINSNNHTAAYPLSSVTSGLAYSFTAEVEAAGYDFVYLNLYGAVATGGPDRYATFNLTTGTVVSQASGVIAAISPGQTATRWIVSITYTMAGTGPLSAYLISANSGTWGTSFVGDGTSGTMVHWAQFEQAPARTAYQKVVSTYDVTEACVPDCAYLAFDGTDDFLVTSAIDFSGTDAVTIFVGVRKLSDAARGSVLELSSGSVDGIFGLEGPSGAATEDYLFYSQGTAVSFQAVTFTAPTSSVVTCVGDISTDLNLIRINGAQVGSVSTNQGSGNYSNFPLYVGRRGGTTLPFNGQISALIIIGRPFTAAEIAATEAWVNARTRAY